MFIMSRAGVLAFLMTGATRAARLYRGRCVLRFFHSDNGTNQNPNPFSCAAAITFSQKRVATIRLQTL